MNAVTVADEACASHPWTHDGSVGRQFKTQKATDAQLVSLGQLDGFEQQLAAMQAMQAAVVVPKI